MISTSTFGKHGVLVTREFSDKEVVPACDVALTTRS